MEGEVNWRRISMNECWSLLFRTRKEAIAAKDAEVAVANAEEAVAVRDVVVVAAKSEMAVVTGAEREDAMIAGTEIVTVSEDQAVTMTTEMAAVDETAMTTTETIAMVEGVKEE